MDVIITFFRDQITGIHYFIYAFIGFFFLFAIIGYLFKQKYAKVEIKLNTSQTVNTFNKTSESSKKLSRKEKKALKTKENNQGNIPLNSKEVGNPSVQMNQVPISNPKVPMNHQVTPPQGGISGSSSQSTVSNSVQNQPIPPVQPVQNNHQVNNSPIPEIK